MAAQILVPFQGDGAGVDDLTWGQTGFWQGMVDTGQSATMGGVTELAPGTTVEMVLFAGAGYFLICLIASSFAKGLQKKVAR